MTWARSLGEFGATIMFAGNVQGRTQTLPLVVYSEFQGGDLDASIAAAAILVLAAFGVLVAVRVFHWGRVGDVRGSPDVVFVLRDGALEPGDLPVVRRHLEQPTTCLPAMADDHRGRARLSAVIPSPEDDHETSWRLDRLDGTRIRRSDTMKISARNQLSGTVKSVTEGAVMAEVVVDVDGGHTIVAAITAESARSLGWRPASPSSRSSSPPR